MIPPNESNKPNTDSMSLSFFAFFQKPFKLARRYWDTLGPGLTTGAADDDPAGIATYSQAGAQYGFQALWISLVSFPLMAVVQEMCARIGLVTGQGLAANIRTHYARPVLALLTVLLVLANIFNIGADLGAMAAAVQLFIPRAPLIIIVIIFGIIGTVLPIYISYARYARFLKYLALILVSYIIALFFVKLDVRDIVLHTLIPHFSLNKETIILICALLGTTISPYLFFWQTSQEVEEGIQKGQVNISDRQRAVSPELIRHMRTDVWSGMLVSNLVMFAIIAVCGATLFQHGITTITTAADAAEALRPLAGDFAYILFALGIIGTGMLAIPVLAGSASYAVSESMGWKFGLFRKWKEATAFYMVIIISVVIGALMNVFHFNIIKVLIASAVINGLVAPFVIYYVVKISSNRHIMGPYANTPIVQILGWCIVIIMTGVGIASIIALSL